MYLFWSLHKHSTLIKLFLLTFCLKDSENSKILTREVWPQDYKTFIVLVLRLLLRTRICTPLSTTLTEVIKVLEYVLR